MAVVYETPQKNATGDYDWSENMRRGAHVSYVASTNKSQSVDSQYAPPSRYPFTVALGAR